MIVFKEDNVGVISKKDKTKTVAKHTLEQNHSFRLIQLNIYVLYI